METHELHRDRLIEHLQLVARGGRDHGKPYHPGYFAAFVLDPDGNNIAGSVKITFG